MNPFKGKGLRPEHFNQKVNYIIDGFLVEQAITMLYAPPKQGKSRLALGLSSYLFDNTEHHVMYLDFDNPLSALVERGVDRVIERGNGRFDYIHPEVAGMESHEVLNKLVSCAEPGAYRKYIFFFDSVTDFTNENDDGASKKFMHKVKALRNAGATVILLHHSNKSEKGYKGSSVLRSAIDNMYLVNLVSSTKEHDVFALEAEAPRFDVRRTAFELNNNSYALMQIEYETAIITPEEKSFIDNVRGVLEKNNEGIGQNKLLTEAGYKAADKHSIALMQKYTKRFWDFEKGAKNAKIYHIL